MPFAAQASWLPQSPLCGLVGAIPCGFSQGAALTHRSRHKLPTNTRDEKKARKRLLSGFTGSGKANLDADELLEFSQEQMDALVGIGRLLEVKRGEEDL